MPADYEMLVSHSPPVYNSHMTDYSSAKFNRNLARLSSQSCRSASANSFLFTPKSLSLSSVPRRPCLVVRPDDTTTTTNSSSCSDDDQNCLSRLKKKVVFADDRGMSLTHVRIMSEPSNVPPFLNIHFLNEVTQGLHANPVARADVWEITFAQPASDYLEFRKTLDSGKVSLENVIVKEEEELVVGTVKVSNFCFEKEVFVRCSSNNWTTHEDIFCKYVSNSSGGNLNTTYILYDTFCFKLPLPLKSPRIEFCVCFRCGGKEFWDNNCGNNFVLIKKQFCEPRNKPISINELNIHNDIPKVVFKCTDALRAKVESWSEFASWNHLENSSPYW